MSFQSLSAQEVRNWESVGNFSYQLQDLDIEAAQKSDVDLLIVDYSADGTYSNRYTKSQVRELQSGPNGKRRLVLAYLSLGEAEEYRFYWPGADAARRAGWLGKPNRDWEKHHRARFWHPRWKEFVFSYLDDIVEAGFDGVYLDRVDVYKEIGSSGLDSREEMISLVAEVAHRGRELGGQDFGIFVQNAEELLHEEPYLQLLTGVGREEVYFSSTRGRRGVPQRYTPYLEQALDHAVASGKLVLSVDYPKNQEQTLYARQRAESRGYLHFAGVRALNNLYGFVDSQKSGR